jgi:hypothetical protein
VNPDACPVCAEPIGDEWRCAVCGWQLRGDPVLGWADERELAEFDQRLDGAAADWDLAAAVRSGANRADTAMLGLRGGMPDEASWAAATAGLSRTEPATADDLTVVLGALTARRTPVVHFVAVGPQGVGHQRVVADDDGFPRTDGPLDTVEWDVAALASDEVVRRFQLAGGLGVQPVDRREFDRAVARLAPRFAGCDCVLVAAEPGWRLLDRARSLLGRMLPVRATLPVGTAPFDLRAVVLDALRSAPLPCDYDVLLQRVDPRTGAIELVTRKLFAAGVHLAGHGAKLTKELVVHGSPVGNPRAAIPVVARTGPDPARWRVLAIGRTDLPAHAAAEVAITLDGLSALGLARADGRPVGRSDDVRLAHLLATIPPQVQLEPPLDVVLAVELCGAPERVRDRAAFAHRLLELVAAGPGRVRAAVLGYLDHRLPPTALYAADPVVIGASGLGSPADAQAELGSFASLPPLRDAATAMEDALFAASRLTWTGGTEVRRALVVVGHRPPCEPTAAGPVPACPDGRNWRDAVRGLRARQVRLIAVRDPGLITTVGGADGDVIEEHAEHAWRELAAERDRFALGPGAADAVAAVLVGRDDIPIDAFPLGLAQPVGTAPSPRKVNR